ncbi:MAG: hypothetical protein IJX55_00675 [Clostridia bacterium]|nr:hypothetical protein [Clostridia bacterium]
MKKILALLLCIPFILLACVSCGKKERDFSKISFEFYSNPYARIPDNEEEFNELLDEFLMTQSDFSYIEIRIGFYSEGESTSDIDLSSLNYYYRKDGDQAITVKIRQNSISREAIMDLTTDERIYSITFVYQFIISPS